MYYDHEPQECWCMLAPPTVLMDGITALDYWPVVEGGNLSQSSHQAFQGEDISVIADNLNSSHIVH